LAGESKRGVDGNGRIADKFGLFVWHESKNKDRHSLGRRFGLVVSIGCCVVVFDASNSSSYNTIKPKCHDERVTAAVDVAMQRWLYIKTLNVKRFIGVDLVDMPVSATHFYAWAWSPH
jgi:hypothetical protein